MTKTNQQKAQQLGMPWGTASARLRKQIMFDLADKAKMLECFRCKEIIENIEEFTIEHKEPWYNVDVNLFWDLDNIAFAHSQCNIPHTRPGKRSSRRGENNTWLCINCKQFLPIGDFSLFSQSSSSANIPRPMCKKCRRLVQKELGKNAI